MCKGGQRNLLLRNAVVECGGVSCSNVDLRLKVYVNVGGKSGEVRARCVRACNDDVAALSSLASALVARLVDSTKLVVEG